MKNAILYILLFCVTSFTFAQEMEKKNISRTIGVSLPFMYVRSSDSYNHRKIGIQYRQCTPKYILQIELNHIGQNQFEAIDANSLPKRVINNDNIRGKSKVDLNYNYNTQITLSKGWTNDFLNIYIGSGLILGSNRLEFNSKLIHTIKEIDTLNQIYNTYNYESDFIKSKANYIYLGLVAKASIEFQINAKFSAMLQFSTFYNYNWRFKSGVEFSKKHFMSLNSNGLELCFSYLL